MKHFPILALGGCLLALALPAHAQRLDAELRALDEQLPGDLINDPRSLEWANYGESCSNETRVDPEIPGGGAAIVFTVERASEQAFDCGTNVPLLGKIEPGQVVTVGFYARTVAGGSSDGKGAVNVRFQENAAPYAGFGDRPLAIGSSWQWYEVSATADRAIRAGSATVALQLAGAKQVVEIGQMIVVTGAPSIAG